MKENPCIIVLNIVLFAPKMQFILFLAVGIIPACATSSGNISCFLGGRFR